MSRESKIKESLKNKLELYLKKENGTNNKGQNGIKVAEII